MKIAMVTWFYPPDIHGGGEISCKLLVDNLRKKGHEVDVFVLDKVFPGIKSKIHLNIKAYDYLDERLDGYDIVHSYNMSLLPCVGQLTKHKDINSIATLNGIVFSPSMSTYNNKIISPKFYRNKLLLKSIKNIKHFITPFVVFRDNWIKDGIPEDKIEVIPTMRDDSFVSSKKKENSDRLELLYIGNYSDTKKKEIDLVFKVFSFLYYKKIHLTVVGDGKDKFEELRKKYGIDNNITIVGKVCYENISDVYSGKDILVYPTEQPKVADRVVYEAIENGLSFVAHGNDYYSSVFKNGEDGILYHPIHLRNIYDGVEFFYSNRNKIKEMNKSAKIKLDTKLSQDVITEKIIEKYKEVLN